mgnify:CR=1 FL=1
MSECVRSNKSDAISGDGSSSFAACGRIRLERYLAPAHHHAALGVPHHRLEQHLEAEAEPLDRGTMCRYAEEVGGTLGATIVHAMLEDARANCRVLSTDATGAAIQPGAKVNGVKQVCKKGHFFTIVADCDIYALSACWCRYWRSCLCNRASS